MSERLWWIALGILITLFVESVAIILAAFKAYKEKQEKENGGK